MAKNYIRYPGMSQNASKKIFQNARLLRGKMTVAEGLLWFHLKQGISGYKFRRQHPIGKYVVDFYCHKVKLIVEIDGGVHDSIEAQALDKERTKDLEGWACSVIRFSNGQVFQEINLVIRAISDKLDMLIKNPKRGI